MLTRKQKLNAEKKRKANIERQRNIQIRSRYFELIRDGVAAEKAAQLASAGEAVKAPAPVPAVQEAPALAPGEIPENWKDLPWPQLRRLAQSLSQAPVKSRADCIKMIGQHLLEVAA
jgi:hypothetical protein